MALVSAGWLTLVNHDATVRECTVRDKTASIPDTEIRTSPSELSIDMSYMNGDVPSPAISCSYFGQQ